MINKYDNEIKYIYKISRVLFNITYKWVGFKLEDSLPTSIKLSIFVPKPTNTQLKLPQTRVIRVGKAGTHQV